MNILFLLRVWPIYSEREIITIKLANEMAYRGWQVNIIYFTSKKINSSLTDPIIDKRIKFLQINNINCDELHYCSNDRKKIEYWFKEYIAQNKINAVINQWWPVEYISFLKKANITIINYPYININNCKSICQTSKRKIEKTCNIIKEFINSSDKFVFLTLSNQREFEEYTNFTDDNNILTSIPIPSLEEKDLNNNTINKKKIILLDETILNPKDILFILHTLNHITNEISNYKWKIQINCKSENIPQYQNFISKLQFSNINFNYLNNSTNNDSLITFVNSKFTHETSLIQMQQKGIIPIAIGSNSILHEIIRENYNGFIIYSNTPKTIANKLLDIIKKDTFLYTISKHCIKTSQIYNTKDIVTLWENIINQKDKKVGNIKKTISVIIPSYGRAHLLPLTIPTYFQDNVCELILINDCSPDNTEEIVQKLKKQYPIIYLKNEINLKQAASKNKGIEIAQGDYIYFGDDDSFLLPNSLKSLSQTLEYYKCDAVMARPLCAGPNYILKYHKQYIQWITHRNKTDNINDIYNLETFKFKWANYVPYPIEVPCMPACALIKTKLAKQCLFDPNYTGSAYREETDFSFRLNIDYNATLIYDSKACQFNLPNYMVRNTGARTGGYEIWKKTTIECNQYFLNKLWKKISLKYEINKKEEDMQKEFIQYINKQNPQTSKIRQLLKNIYFKFLIYK